jgi:hypothetical protein
MDDATFLYPAKAAAGPCARLARCGGRGFLMRACRLVVSASSDPEYATATRAMASMLLCVPNRLLFTTSNGYMGLGPKMAQVGDLVYVLLGGELPYVLRRQEDTDTFQFIGECYVHGLMNGEGLVDARNKSRPTEVPPEDNSWLDRLDELEEGELPFETEVVTLV